MNNNTEGLNYKRKGQRVHYKVADELGTIVSESTTYVHVLYDGDKASKATLDCDLENIIKLENLTDNELNTLCAEKVMELEPIILGSENWFAGYRLDPRGATIDLFEPLTIPAHNDMLLDRMVKMGFERIDIAYTDEFERWAVMISKDAYETVGEGEHPDRKRAIVIACLRTKRMIE